MHEFEEKAFEIARDSHEEDFSTRRGTGSFRDEPRYAFLYDNNPYASDSQRRDRELEALVAVLSGRGIRVVARASYPPPGSKDAGYTVAIIFDATDFAGDTESAVQEEWTKVLKGDTVGTRMTRTGVRLSLIKSPPT